MRAYIGFGGGCHWCTEAVFQHLVGVHSVEQGFIASTPPHDTLSEAVRVTFDPDMIPLHVLIEVHLHTHSSTSMHALRDRYRSAVYTTSDALESQIRETLMTLQETSSEPFILEVLPLARFELNDERYWNYYINRPDAPFCDAYIKPKLDTLRARFERYYRDTTPTS